MIYSHLDDVIYVTFGFPPFTPYKREVLAVTSHSNLSTSPELKSEKRFEEKDLKSLQGYLKMTPPPTTLFCLAAVMMGVLQVTGEKRLMPVAAAPAPPSAPSRPSVDKLFSSVSSNVSKWHFDDGDFGYSMCPNTYGDFKTAADGSFLMRCNSHDDIYVQALYESFDSDEQLNDTERREKNDYIQSKTKDLSSLWSMRFNRSAYPDETIVSLCDRCSPCRSRFEYKSPEGFCCQACPAGFYAVEHCTQNGAASKCEVCPSDSYKDNSYLGTSMHRESCNTRKTECPANTHLRSYNYRQPGHGYTTDNVCDPEPGYYCPGVSVGTSCHYDAQWAMCPTGQYTFRHHTREDAAQCGHCADNQYVHVNPRTKLATCYNHSVCPPGAVEVRKGTKNHDTICGPAPTPSEEL